MHMTTQSSKILTLNSGSSSLKFSIYEMQPKESLICAGKVNRIGLPGSHLEISDGNHPLLKEQVDATDHAVAIHLILTKLQEQAIADELSAIGHRVVMGGPEHTAPQIVTPTLIEELEDLSRIDPPHLPAALKTIAAAQKFRPGIPQIACFDTAFHRTMPKIAQLYSFPRELSERFGIIRYGFHGLSYEYIHSELSRIDSEAACGKVIIAHLGNGASMVALDHGKSVETTMGFTPAGGLVMSSRTGDLDPGVLLYLLTQKQISMSELNALIYSKSGLAGISNLSSDMQDLIEKRESYPQAQEAIDLFCYQARKHLGALAAVLNGLETLIFTGGIGEHASLIRAQICDDLSYLGVSIDQTKNATHDPIISKSGNRVTVRVMKTNEELLIARHTDRILNVEYRMENKRRA
jgi:acetate kinase